MTHPLHTVFDRDAVPVGHLLRETAASLQRVMEGELQLAVARVQDDVEAALRRGALRAVAGVFCLVTLLLLEVTAVLFAATLMQPWRAALLVAGLNVLMTVLFWTLPIPKPKRASPHVHSNGITGASTHR